MATESSKISPALLVHWRLFRDQVWHALSSWFLCTEIFSLVMMKDDLESSKAPKQMPNFKTVHAGWSPELAQQGCRRCFSSGGECSRMQRRCQEHEIWAWCQHHPGQKNWPVVQSALCFCFSPCCLRRQKIRHQSIFFFF